MTLCLSVALPELALVASTTRTSVHDGGTGQWKGVRADRTAPFSNVRRVGGGPCRGGWVTGGGCNGSVGLSIRKQNAEGEWVQQVADRTTQALWELKVYDALEHVPADDVDALSRTVREVIERHAATLGHRRIPPGEENPERWPGGVHVIHATPLGFARTTIYGNGEISGREYWMAYRTPIEWAQGLSVSLRRTYEEALLADRTLSGALRATARLFAEVSRLCGPVSSVGDLFEVGALRKEMLPEKNRWQLRFDYLPPIVARRVLEATDADLETMVTLVDALTTVEALTC